MYSCAVTERPFSYLKSSPASLVSQGKHSGTTIPISAASSQPAILQTSVEEIPEVSHLEIKQREGEITFQDELTREHLSLGLYGGSECPKQ